MVIYESKDSRRYAASQTSQRRWMLFVDGENLTIRTESLAKSRGVSLRPGPYYSPEVFIWHPRYHVQAAAGFINLPDHLLEDPIRAYYYTSAVGDEPQLDTHRDALTSLGFKALVGKRTKTRASKGVDIALATEMLSNACSGNFDSVVLIAGDADFVPLVEEVQRRGRQTFVAFWQDSGLGLSPSLRRAADGFLPLSETLLDSFGD